MASRMANSKRRNRRSDPGVSDSVNVYREIDGRLVSVYEREKYVVRYEWVVEECTLNGKVWASKTKRPLPFEQALRIMLSKRKPQVQETIYLSVIRADTHDRLRNVKTGEVVPGEAIV